MSKTQEALEAAKEFDRYFTSMNGVDVDARISVPRDEWRALRDKINAAIASREPMHSDKIDDVFASALANMRKHSKTATGALTDEDRYEFHLVRAIERFHGIGK